MALKQIIAGTAVACLAFAAVGCGSSSGSKSSSTTTTAKQAVCADKDKLQSSVKDLTDPNVLTGGKSSITKALDQVQKNLTALRSSVSADLQPKVDDVKPRSISCRPRCRATAASRPRSRRPVTRSPRSARRPVSLISSLDAECS